MNSKECPGSCFPNHFNNYHMNHQFPQSTLSTKHANKITIKMCLGKEVTLKVKERELRNPFQGFQDHKNHYLHL